MRNSFSEYIPINNSCVRNSRRACARSSARVRKMDAFGFGDDDCSTAVTDEAYVGALRQRSTIRYNATENPYNIPIDVERLDVRLVWLFTRPEVEQHSAEWHRLREGHITGSRVGAVLNHDHFKTRREVWEELCNLRPPDEDVHGYMARGTRLEPVAAAKYAVERKQCCFSLGFVEHPHYSYLGVSPDRVTLSCLNVEIKCPAKRFVKRGFTARQLYVELPHYHDQVMHEMAITGMTETDFCQYKPSPDGERSARYEILEITRVAYDPLWLPTNEPKLRTFWDEVELYRSEHPNWRDRRWPGPPPPDQLDRIVPERPDERADRLHREVDLHADSDSEGGGETSAPRAKKRCPFGASAVPERLPLPRSAIVTEWPSSLARSFATSQPPSPATFPSDQRAPARRSATATTTATTATTAPTPVRKRCPF